MYCNEYNLSIMKKLLSLVLLFVCAAAAAFGSEAVGDYIVKTTKAPVWTYQSVSSPVLGYLDYGVVPASEVDGDDPQWIYVERGELKGWSHILAFSHRASEQEELDLANGSFADYLREEGADEEVVAACTTGTPKKAADAIDREDFVQEYRADDRYIEPYSARGLEPMFIYVIDRDVECPVNEAYAYHGQAIRYVKSSETFSGGTWFAREGAEPDGLVLMSEGKGFDLPASAYHLLTEEEYIAYMNRELELNHLYAETPLRYYLETHDVAQAEGWSVDFGQYTRKTLADLWPMLLPLLVLLAIFGLGMRQKANPTLWAYAAIADLLVFCAVCWHYISMPSAQFNDLGGLAWIPIALVVLVAMALILFVAWSLGSAVLARCDVSIGLKTLGVGFALGIALCIAADLVMILLLGCDASSVAVGVVNMCCILGGALGWTAYRLVRQNPAVVAALPAVFVLWTIAILLGLALIAIALFVIFFIVVWMFMSGNMGGGKNIIPGLVGSEQATCSKCRHFGTARCPRPHPSGSDAPCSSFE